MSLSRNNHHPLFTDPSGTPGPQMSGRNYYQQSSAGESFTTTKPGAKEDNVPPPKIAPPVFISVPPAPPAPSANGPPVAPMRSRGPPPPPFGPPRRNVPVRSHSMSMADINRFYGSPPLPRFRPPPPPNSQQRNAGAKVEITELGVDSASENEDEVHKKPNKPKKHFIHHNNQVNEFCFFRIFGGF